MLGVTQGGVSEQRADGGQAGIAGARAIQGNRISEGSEEFGEIGIVPTGPLELAAQRGLRAILLHDVEGHVSQDRKIAWPFAQSGPVLILVHRDIQPPVQPVFHTPVLADDLVEACRG